MKSPVWTIDAYYDFLGLLWKEHVGGWERKKKEGKVYVYSCVLPFIVLKKKEDEIQIMEAGILCWTAPSYAFTNICIAGKTKIHNNKHFEISILMMSSYFVFFFFVVVSIKRHWNPFIRFSIENFINFSVETTKSNGFCLHFIVILTWEHCLSPVQLDCFFFFSLLVVMIIG